MYHYVVHLAGDLIDGVQRCVRCDIVLSNNRGAMVPAGMDNGPLQYAAGHLIAFQMKDWKRTNPQHSFDIGDRELESDESLCRESEAVANPTLIS